MVTTLKVINFHQYYYFLGNEINSEILNDIKDQTKEEHNIITNDYDQLKISNELLETNKNVEYNLNMEMKINDEEEKTNNSGQKYENLDESKEYNENVVNFQE